MCKKGFTMELTKTYNFMRIALIAFLDMIIVAAGGLLALLVRFDFRYSSVPAEYLDAMLRFAPMACVITVAVFLFTRMYRYVWRTVGLHDVIRMVLSVVVDFVFCAVAALVCAIRLPISVWFSMAFFCAAGFVGMRCVPRFYIDLIRYASRSRRSSGQRILLVGGGAAGRALVQESLSGDTSTGTICCIVDDNPAKEGKYIEGVKIIGGRERIPWAVEQYDIDQIILALPSASAEQQRSLLQICQNTGCKVRTVPGMSQLMNGEVTMRMVRDVEIEDLLGRDSVHLDESALHSFLGGKVVLVTGGGGSIGSELCRQIAKYRPRLLIVLDIYENNAYDLQQELRQTYGDTLPLRVEIASVRDKARIYQIFEQYHPQLVFHAAAHKHVPLMENCCAEAVKNNVFGTYHVVRAAEKFGAEKFVMISTDKAVNPTNIMGATKRFCEMVLQSRFDSPTEYCAVRFGNVLGSNGSVVPLFKRQIAAGGPVTITDKRIIRYFMTIPEAASLVLQAGAMARQGQVFVLDMGEPVKILDLAENLIRLSGYQPYRDIDIQEIGLRPGEKLYEELLMASNDLMPTDNKKIFVEQQPEIDRAAIMAGLEQLDAAVTTEPPLGNEQIIALMRRLVPTYHSPQEVNRTAESAPEMRSAQKEGDKELAAV